MKLALLHSPLVGAKSWTALAPILEASGHDVTVLDLAKVFQNEPPYYPHLAQMAARYLLGESLLVVHSGAGALVPAIAQTVPLAGAIFVDALLPHPGRAWFETVPQSLNARLRSLAKDSRLPPWDRWWPQGAIERLLGDRETYERFAADLPSVPLAYFEERAPEAPLATPSAYLQLSDAYQADADRAAAEGWPVTRLNLHHLAMLTQPDAVAREIERLAAKLA